MSERTGIAWTDSTWNPVRGCSRVSEGCRNCYAEKVAARFSDPGRPYHGFAEQSPARWTGKVALVEKHLLDPLRWKKPRRIFVNSMSDLFHEGLPMEAIARVFAVMALAERHTFQVLTKRPLRMQTLLSERGDHPPASFLSHVGRLCEYYAETVERQSAGAMMGFDAWWQGIEEKGYLPNVWLGVSTEDQATADGRIPLLLQTPAAVRFLSVEPLLEAVNIRAGLCRCQGTDPILHKHYPDETRSCARCSSCHAFVGLDWAIVGGESGPGARPCDVSWVRSIVAQCKAAGVACFVKQLGALIAGDPGGMTVDRWVGDGWKFVPPMFVADYAPERSQRPTNAVGFQLFDRKGGKPYEWTEDLQVQEFPR